MGLRPSEFSSWVGRSGLVSRVTSTVTHIRGRRTLGIYLRRVQSLGVRASGVQGLGFRVQSLRFRASASKGGLISKYLLFTGDLT